MMGKNLVMNILFLKFLGIFMFLQNVHSVSVEKFDESQMKQWSSAFKQELDSHIDKVLAYRQIEQMLENFETNLVHGPIIGEEIFSEIFQNVSLRYNDVVLAANRLKKALEKDVGLLDHVDSTGAPSLGGGPPPLLLPSSSGGPPLLPLTKCCCESSLGDFDGRLRDRVQSKECYGSQDALLESVSKTGFVNTLKENYKTLRGVTWQYFADSAGHYVQFPTSNRACDRSAPPLLGSCSKLESPLTKEWFVEKLRMEHKNVVILMDNSMKRDPSVPPVAESAIAQAVDKILDTLTPSDKVNVVAFPSSTSETVEVPTRCKSGLFVASEANLNILKVYTKQLTSGTGEPNLMGGLRKVYSLLEAENNENPDNFKTRTNLVLVLLHGQSKPFPQEETTVLEMIAQHQLKLENRTQHFIYTLGRPSDTETLDRLAQVADQNNMKLEKSSGIKVQAWPLIPDLVTNQPVGPEGVLVTVDSGEDFASAAGKYFQRLPPQVDKELTTIVPVLDNKYGLGLTVAVPVYNESEPIGVVAADGSLATIFSEIVNFKTGINSYMFLVDSTHGHVLLHPKLRDPAETRYKDTIFPRLDLLEPDLTAEQRNRILTAGTRNAVSFQVKVTDIHPEIDGELVANRLFSFSNATVYCQQIAGTSLVVALVHYESDDEEPKFNKLSQISLHGIYHRLDKLFGAPDFPGKDSICHLHNGHFLSFKQSVIKFAPSIFSDPELYKYSDETLKAVVKLNKFLSDGTYTDILNPGLKDIVLHTLAATDTLDSLWTSSAKQVIERFYGSTDGVFRMYPGSPLVNTFDHRGTDWYKRSIAFPNTTMYHYGKLSVRNTNSVIIISRAVGMKRLQGVVGMTVTPRFLISQLLNTVKDCSGNNYKCHVVDSTGRVFDALNPDSAGHLVKMYPWLTAELVTRKKIKQEWCTGFSDGFHKMILTLTEDVTFNSVSDPCLQFSLHKVKDTNLYVLVLRNREKCVESNYKKCSSCQTVSPNPIYQLSIPKCKYCQVNKTMTRCQCQCYCDTDLDTCHGQFNIHLQNFPTRSCFYAPTYSKEFMPDAPGPGDHLDRCPIPCVAIEDLDVCSGLAHCKVSSGVYPTCIWKDEDELKTVNVSRFFPTTTPPRPPMPSTTGGLKPSVTTAIGPVSPHPDVTSSNSPVSPSVAAISPPHKPPTAPAGKSTIPVKSSPDFVSTTKTSPVAPVMTGSPVHPVTGSAVKPTGSAIVTSSSTAVTKIIQSVSTRQTEKPLGNSSNEDDHGLSGGAIAALVIGILALVAIIVFIAVKMYHKKFRRPGADEAIAMRFEQTVLFKYLELGDSESSKYRTTGSSMFDSTVFLRNLDQVSINASAPNSTNVPYQEMAN